MDEVKLSRFLRRIEEGYPENPYHNRVHACDVLQSIHMVMVKGGLFPVHIDKLSQLAAYMAAVRTTSAQLLPKLYLFFKISNTKRTSSADRICF